MQVIQDEFVCLVEGLVGLKARLMLSVEEIEAGSASTSEVCQPGAEADDEPFADVEGFEKDELYPLEGGADGVDYTYTGLLRCHKISPPR